jgi:hypothetical protein
MTAKLFIKANVYEAICCPAAHKSVCLAGSSVKTFSPPLDVELTLLMGLEVKRLPKCLKTQPF